MKHRKAKTLKTNQDSTPGANASAISGGGTVPIARAAIPGHLPDHLAISVWFWLWATHSQEGELFHDLEHQVIELKKRGFNCIRIEAFPSLIFVEDGSLRPAVEFQNPIEPEFGINVPGLDPVWRGGQQVQLLERLLLLLHLAEKHGVFVVLTSWEYQPGHTHDVLADGPLREEILALRQNIDERARVLTRKWEMLLTIVKREGLSRQIAYVEIHNEWSECDQKPAAEAIDYLAARFPELLFSFDSNLRALDNGGFFDFNRLASTIKEMVPDNTQVFDYHPYAGAEIQDELMFDVTGLRQVLGKKMEDADEKMVELEKDGSPLRRLMRPDFMPWREFRKHVRRDNLWSATNYLFYNLDPDRWDEWMFANYPRYAERFRTRFRNTAQYCAQVARERNIPIVADEGGSFFLPPTNSRFEPSAVGRRMFEENMEDMLANGFWGILISTYAYPGDPLWEYHADWLLKVNRRITTGE